MPQTEGSKHLKRLRAALDETAVMSDGRRAKMYIGKLGEVPVCIVFRNSNQVFRGGASSLTEASAAGTLCWMMDTTLLPILRDLYGVEYLLTLERETGDLWVSKLADWFDADKTFRITDPALAVRTYRGAALTYLPTRQMLHLDADRQLILHAQCAIDSQSPLTAGGGLMDFMDPVTEYVPPELTAHERAVAIASFKQDIANACEEATRDGLTLDEVSAILRQMADECER